MLVLLNDLPVRVALALLIASHAIAIEDALTAGTDLLDAVHGGERLCDQVTRVTGRDVAAAGERECCVDDHLFPGGLAEGFRPFEFAGVTCVCVLVSGGRHWGGGEGRRRTLHFKVLVAFAPAETEFFCIVTDKHDPVARIYRARAITRRSIAVSMIESSLENSGGSAGTQVKQGGGRAGGRAR